MVLPQLRTYALMAAILLFVAVVIVLPLGVVIGDAFLVRTGETLTVTLRHFGKVLSSPAHWDAFLNTAVVALGATVIATVLGVALALVLVRTNVPGAKTLERLAIVPIFIPPFVGAFAWVLLAAPRVGLLNKAAGAAGLGEPLTVYGYAGIAWVIGIYLAPYVQMIVASALRSMDPSLEEAGQVSGLSRLRTGMTVTLPVVAPAILSGAVLAFVITIGLFGTPVLLGWSKQIHLITSRIYIESIEQPPEYGVMAVLAIILMLLSIGAMALQKWVVRGRSYVTVTGKGFRSRPMELGRARHLLLAGVLLYILLTVVGPIGIIAVAAFSTYTWSGIYTIDNIAFLWTSPDVLVTFGNSLLITVIAATIAIAFGMAVAWITNRTRLPGRTLLEYLVLLPVSVPGIAFAVGVMFLWLRLPLAIYGTLWIIVLGFIGRFSAYAVRNMSSSLVQIHPELEECARVSGYNGPQTLRRITLPLIWPSVISSWILLYSIFITELSMVVLLHTTHTRTFSILSFETWYQGQFSKVASLSLLQLVVGVAIMYAIQSLTKQRASKDV